MDPRHRLVTTKYNPAWTWTPKNAVGIGDAYMCMDGMEGSGGYQFIGRTVPVWDRSGADPPWLLRHFNRIRWNPVSAEELLDLRAAADAGQMAIPITNGTFRFSDHTTFLDREASTIASFRRRQTEAFAAERRAREASGELSAKEPS